MHFKLIIALVEDNATDAVLNAARRAGATGSTVITQARGEGAQKIKPFFGLYLESQRDVVLLVVEEHISRNILETIAKEARFEEKSGTGIALQIDIEDVVGIYHQIRVLSKVVEETL